MLGGVGYLNMLILGGVGYSAGSNPLAGLSRVAGSIGDSKSGRRRGGLAVVTDCVS